MPVLDASALFSYLTAARAYDAVHDALWSSDELVWAPHLVDAEVGHVLRRAVMRNKLLEDQAAQALRTLADMPLRRAVHAPLLARAWALRSRASFYDALYLALAELLEMPLLTLDARLSRVAGTSAQVQVLG